MQKILVVGDGIAGRLTIYRLLRSILERSQSDKNHQLVIDHLFHTKHYPPATTVSTSHVGAMGIERGRGELGDLLLDGLEELKRFIANDIGSSPTSSSDWGIAGGVALHLELSDNFTAVKKLGQRFGEKNLQSNDRLFGLQTTGDFLCAPVDNSHLFFTPEIFSQRLLKEIELMLNSLQAMGVSYHRRECGVEGLERISESGWRVFLENCKTAEYDSVVIAAGAWELSLQEDLVALTGDSFKSAQQRAGSVWIKDVSHRQMRELFCEHDPRQGLVISSGGATLTYRPRGGANRDEWGELMIGGTSSHRASLHAVAWPELVGMHQHFFDLFAGPSILDFESARIQTGLRHHLPKRRPFCGDLVSGENLFFKSSKENAPNRDSGLYGIRGLYKSGYNLAFLGSLLLAQRALSGLG